MSKLIYIADDEKQMRHLIRSFLEKDGYAVHDFDNGDSLYEAFMENPCDLIILDVVMPGSSGFLICSKLREISAVPIIMLTARDTDEDYISGISLGSDDYFTKPFSPVKLIMRVKAMFRRIDMENQAHDKDKGEIVYADLSICPDKFTACLNGKQIALTHTEFNLLLFLVKNQDRAVSRDELLSTIWGYDSVVETRATDDTVKRLRRKLAGSKIVIDTVRGYGFRIGTQEGE